MKVIFSLALVALLPGCQTVPDNDEDCWVCFSRASPATDVQMASGMVSQSEHHEPAKLS